MQQGQQAGLVLQVPRALHRPTEFHQEAERQADQRAALSERGRAHPRLRQEPESWQLRPWLQEHPRAAAPEWYPSSRRLIPRQPRC